MRTVRRALRVWWQIAILLVALFAGLRRGSSAGARAPAADAPPVHLPAEGELAFDVREAPSGGPIPCKLTLVGVDRTPNPQFTRVDIGRPEGDGAIAAFNRIMSLKGVGAARVPVGTYDVTVSRGPEWDIQTRRVKIGATGSSASVAVRLTHVAVR
jgi:hypothetical protein